MWHRYSDNIHDNVVPGSKVMVELLIAADECVGHPKAIRLYGYTGIRLYGYKAIRL